MSNVERRAGYVITYIPMFGTESVDTAPIQDQVVLARVMFELVTEAKAVVLHVRYVGEDD